MYSNIIVLFDNPSKPLYPAGIQIGSWALHRLKISTPSGLDISIVDLN